MSNKPKSISELINTLEAENYSLKELDKLANQYCKMEFNLNVQELHQALEKLLTFERKANLNEDNPPVHPTKIQHNEF